MIGSAALAGAALLALQGCAPGASADPDPSTGHDPAYAQVMAQADRVYQHYLLTSAAAAADGDQALALSVVANAQWFQTKGQYKTRASTGTPVPQYRYGTPHYILPEPAGYPRWFMVTVPRSTAAGGRAGPVVTTVMLFEQTKATRPWTLDSAVPLDRPLPELAYASDGYAVAVPDGDTGPLLPPDVIGPSQAAVVDHGPGSPSAAVISAGPLTTGLYAAQAALGRAQSARGLVYQWLLLGASYPQFQLRLRSGADLVLYGMYLDTTIEHPNLRKGSPIPAPAEFSPLFAAPTEVAYHAVYGNWTYQFVAIDPPAGAHAKVAIIAANGSPSYGHAY